MATSTRRPKTSGPAPRPRKAASAAGDMSTGSPGFALMAECSRFVADRIRQNLEFQAALVACREPSEVMGLQSAYLARAFEQYGTELARCSAMVSGTALSSASGPFAAVSRAYDDVPV